jgi:hypothetical protein
VSVKSVTFTFGANTSPEEQQRTLAEIRHWHGVKSAAHLKPGTSNAALARMAYAVLAADADAEDIAAHLDQHPLVESAAVPSQRYLSAK